MAMIFLNEISLTGRLTKKPELRFYKNSNGIDSPVTTARICFNDKRNSSRVNFINVEVFGQKAVRICEKCDKGSLVYVKGSLRKTKYTTKDGHTRYKVDILCESIRQAEGVYLNNLEISGYITRKPEFKNIITKTGTNLELATTSVAFKDKRNYDNSYFINVVIFGDNAKRFYENLEKGTPVYMKGNLKNTSYEKNGERRHYLEFVIEEYQKIYIKKNDSNSNNTLDKDIDTKEENIINEDINKEDINKIEVTTNQKDDNIFGFSLMDYDDIPF
ncbi:MAG: single-stranded DNA-binding protein [Romboutsia sp.]|nr:single-stranded DNA-binding protein [Romboutsia sp.]